MTGITLERCDGPTTALAMDWHKLVFPNKSGGRSGGRQREQGASETESQVGWQAVWMG